MLRCGNGSCRVEDPILQEYLGTPIRTREPLVFLQDRGKLFRGNCPKCSKPGNTLVCPHCHNEIPKEMINANITVISLIGVSGVGKTHFVTLLLKRSLSNLARFGISTRRLGEQTFERMDNNYNKYLASETPGVIPRTIGASTDTSIRYPWIFVLDRRVRRFFRGALKSVYLVIYDAAGEDFLSSDMINANVASIAESDGWVFLLDPLQFPRLQQELPKHLIPDAVSDQTAAIERAYSFVRSKKNDSVVTKPIAMTMTKIDVLETCLQDIPGHIFKNRNYKSTTDLEGIDLADGVIRRLIEDNMQNDFISQVDNYFSRSKFFGISALGSPPEGGRLVNGLKPLRLEDPILWLLTALKRWDF